MAPAAQERVRSDRQSSVQAVRLDSGRAQAQGESGVSRQNSTAAERRYLALVATLECVICRRFERTGLPVEIHHIASGSSRTSHWLIVPLCGSVSDGGHHRGGAGLHGMGTKAFCSLYRIPHESEYGLIALVNEDLCAKLTLRRVA
jgi:hypothetical protein